jgi:hypothetical protein
MILVMGVRLQYRGPNNNPEANPQEGTRNMIGSYVKMDIIQFAGIRLAIYFIVGCPGFEPRDAERRFRDRDLEHNCDRHSALLGTQWDFTARLGDVCFVCISAAEKLGNHPCHRHKDFALAQVSEKELLQSAGK